MKLECNNMMDGGGIIRSIMCTCYALCYMKVITEVSRERQFVSHSRLFTIP